MKIDEKLVKKINELNQMGVEYTKIKDILDLEDDVEVVLSKFEEEKGFLTVEQTAEMLEKALKKPKSKEVWNKHKVYRLMKEGVLKPIDDKPANKIGYRFRIEEVEALINEQLLSKEELLEENKQLKARVQELEEALAARTNEEEVSEVPEAGQADKNANSGQSKPLNEEGKPKKEVLPKDLGFYRLKKGKYEDGSAWFDWKDKNSGGNKFEGLFSMAEKQFGHLLSLKKNGNEVEKNSEEFKEIQEKVLPVMVKELTKFK